MKHLFTPVGLTWWLREKGCSLLMQLWLKDLLSNYVGFKKCNDDDNDGDEEEDYDGGDDHYGDDDNHDDGAVDGGREVYS